jgi:tetratricopeptide (TPR) repeat protein
MTLAKGLAGGVAIGAMLATEEVAEAFGPGSHASTFGGNPIAAAAGIAALRATVEDGVLENCRKVGAYLFERLNKLKKEYAFIKEIRGKGLIIGMELTIPGAGIVDKCLEKRLLINCTGDTILRFLPPLIVTEAEVDEMPFINEKTSMTKPYLKTLPAILISASLFACAHGRTWTELNARAVNFYQQGRYAEAAELAEDALKVAERSFGPEHMNVAQSLNNLAGIYRRALRIREEGLGPEHPAVAVILNNLGELYRSQGEYGRAEPLFERALVIRIKALGMNDPSVATTLNNLAELYCAQGKHEKAEPVYRRAIEIFEGAFRPDQYHYAKSMINLAGLYRTQGKYEQAEPLYKKALKILESSLGEDHPDVATTLNNLAELYRVNGEFENAEPLYMRALAIQERSLGHDHLNVAATLNNMALLYFLQGRFPEVGPLYKRALAIKEKALGPVHPGLLDILDNLAQFYRETDREEEGASEIRALPGDNP